jgi:hypothetical protein
LISFSLNFADAYELRIKVVRGSARRALTETGIGLEAHVLVLTGRASFFFVGECFEGSDEEGAGVARVDELLAPLALEVAQPLLHL